MRILYALKPVFYHDKYDWRAYAVVSLSNISKWFYAFHGDENTEQCEHGCMAETFH